MFTFAMSATRALARCTLLGYLLSICAGEGEHTLGCGRVEVDKNGQHVKKRLFYSRFGNGTRAIADPTKRER